jgi:hypothetical protein
MMTYIASLALMALVAAPGIVAHHHCPDDYANPLCVPKGAIPHAIDGGLSGAIEKFAHRGSGRVDPNQPPARQG